VCLPANLPAWLTGVKHRYSAPVRNTPTGGNYILRLLNKPGIALQAANFNQQTRQKPNSNCIVIYTVKRILLKMETRYAISRNNPGYIDISEYYAIEIWASKLGVSPEQLRLAVKAVGNSVPAVEKYLKR